MTMRHGWFSFTQLIIVSYLTGDPELRVTPAGKPSASFPISSAHIYQDKLGLKHTEVQSFNCLAFGGLANACQAHLKQGQHVVIVGTLAPQTSNATLSTVHVNGIQVIDGHSEKAVAEDTPDSVGEIPLFCS
jgi:primosomal replication protein N